MAKGRQLLDILTAPGSRLNLLPSGTAGVDQFLRKKNDGTSPSRPRRPCSFSLFLFVASAFNTRVVPPSARPGGCCRGELPHNTRSLGKYLSGPAQHRTENGDFQANGKISERWRGLLFEGSAYNQITHPPIGVPFHCYFGGFVLLSGRDRIELCFAIGRLLDLYRTMLYHVVVGFEQEAAKARTRAVAPCYAPRE